MRKCLVLSLIALIAAPAGAGEKPRHPSGVSQLETRVPSRSSVGVRLNLLYSQSSEIWKTAAEIDAAKGNVPAINEVLRRKYGQYEEAIGRFGMSVVNLGGLSSEGAFRNSYVSLQAETVGSGQVHNPVVPELHSVTLFSGVAHFGFKGDLARDVKHEIGVLAGYGTEKRVDAYSTDLIESKPVRTGKFSVMGAQWSVERKDRLGGGFDLGVEVSQRLVWFQSNTPASTLSFGEGSTSLHGRWKLKGLLLKRGSGLELIAGPQPLPVDFLPVTWDFAHKVNAFPELGAMLGAGGVLETGLGGKSRWITRAGFYGGYVCAATTVSVGDLAFGMSSWGIEGSSAYQVMGQRHWLGSFGVAL